jgi:hypothetical protein
MSRRIAIPGWQRHSAHRSYSDRARRLAYATATILLSLNSAFLSGDSAEAK